MLTKHQSRLLAVLGGLALALSVANAGLLTITRGRQVELSRQQLFIQQTAPLEALYRDMVKTLADTAVRTNDRQVLDMLAAQGLNVTIDNPPAKADR